MAELRQAELPFTPGEVAAFLGQSPDLALEADDVAALAVRTEGWIAGLQMVAFSIHAVFDLIAITLGFLIYAG